eukprot:8224921-Pyramimonas_sp.AAC.1
MDVGAAAKVGVHVEEPRHEIADRPPFATNTRKIASSLLGRLPAEDIVGQVCNEALRHRIKFNQAAP